MAETQRMECTQCNVMQSGSRLEQQPQKKNSSYNIESKCIFNNVFCRDLLRGGCHGVCRFPPDPGVAEERLPSQGHLPRPQQGRMAEGLRPDRGFAGAPLSHPDTPGLAIKSFFAVSFLKKKIIYLPRGQINDPSLRKHFSLPSLPTTHSYSSPSWTFEGFFELTGLPQLTSCVASGTTEKQGHA